MQIPNMQMSTESNVTVELSEISVLPTGNYEFDGDGNGLFKFKIMTVNYAVSLNIPPTIITMLTIHKSTRLNGLTFQDKPLPKTSGVLLI